VASKYFSWLHNDAPRLYSQTDMDIDKSRILLKPKLKGHLMKINYSMKFFLFSLFIALSLSAQAIIIDGTFKGKIISANEDGTSNSPDDVDFFSSNIVDNDFSGSFWYDIDLAPTNWGTTGQSRSSEGTNWFELTFYVDGKTLNSDTPPEGSTIFATSELHIIAEPTAFTSLRNYAAEYFGLSEMTAATDGSLIHNQFAGISFLDSIIPSLSGNSLFQSFTWYDTDETYNNWEVIPGFAFYMFRDDVVNTPVRSAYFVGRISEMTVGPRQTSVPEPSTLLLLGLGAMTLLIRNRKFII
jgi:hypothetical protein